MRKRLAVLVSAVVMMLMMAAPAMASPLQFNAGSASAGNFNLTNQINVGVQNNTQVAVFGNNYSNQEQNQANLNATKQNAAAFAGNAALFSF